jgi:hypothetical protein
LATLVSNNLLVSISSTSKYDKELTNRPRKCYIIKRLLMRHKKITGIMVKNFHNSMSVNLSMNTAFND